MHERVSERGRGRGWRRGAKSRESEKLFISAVCQVILYLPLCAQSFDADAHPHVRCRHETRAALSALSVCQSSTRRTGTTDWVVLTGQYSLIYFLHAHTQAGIHTRSLSLTPGHNARVASYVRVISCLGAAYPSHLLSLCRLSESFRVSGPPIRVISSFLSLAVFPVFALSPSLLPFIFFHSSPSSSLSPLPLPPFLSLHSLFLSSLLFSFQCDGCLVCAVQRRRRPRGWMLAAGARPTCG